MGTIPFDKEIGQKWIAALRSGKYKQGFRRLKKDDCYCALGVLGVVCGYDDKLVGQSLTPFIVRPRQPLWYKLKTPVGSWTFEDFIMIINDKEKRSLDEIALWLEQNLMWDE